MCLYSNSSIRYVFPVKTCWWKTRRSPLTALITSRLRISLITVQWYSYESFYSICLRSTFQGLSRSLHDTPLSVDNQKLLLGKCIVRRISNQRIIVIIQMPNLYFTKMSTVCWLHFTESVKQPDSKKDMLKINPKNKLNIISSRLEFWSLQSWKRMRCAI